MAFYSIWEEENKFFSFSVFFFKVCKEWSKVRHYLYQFCERGGWLWMELQMQMALANIAKEDKNKISIQFVSVLRH